MTLNDIPKSEWTRYLSACVSLKANKVLSNLSLEDNLSYDVCKKAVLSYYRLDSTSYQRKFRESKCNSDKSFKMLRQRLKDLLSYFCESKGINSYESRFDDVLGEQICSLFDAETMHFVLSKQPKSSQEMCDYADLFLDMAKNAGNNQQNGAIGGGPVSKGYPKSNPTAETTPTTTQANAKPSNKGKFAAGSNGTKRTPPQCYKCNSTDHKINNCPYVNGNNFTLCTWCKAYHAIKPQNYVSFYYILVQLF